jgi:phytoene synthase
MQASVADLPQQTAKLLRRLTTRSSSNFKFAFLFLGREQRDALSHVYEFCRVVDDIVDERAPGEAGIEAAKAQLREWSTEIARIFADPYVENVGPQTDLGKALAASRSSFDFPREAFDEIIAGVQMDLHTNRYEDLDALRLYCYRVASCVGFLCLPIFGDTSKEAHEYAEHLGLALQYTNILRDIAEDGERDRCTSRSRSCSGTASLTRT